MNHPITVVFQAVGPDPRVSELERLTASKLYNQKKEMSTDDRIIHFIELELTSNAVDEETALSIATSWLEANCSLLDDLDARLMLEIQTAIGQDDGSKALMVGNEFLCLLADIGCDLLHQYARSLSAEERSRLRLPEK